MEHFDWKMGFWVPYTNFFIFFFLAIYFFKKPIRAMAQKRRDDYLEAFRAASEAKAEAEAVLAQLNVKMNDLDSAVEKIKQQAIGEAKIESDKIIASAKLLASHLKLEASRVADAEVHRARIRIQSEILSAAKKSTIEKIEKNFSDASQHEYIQKNISAIGQLEVRV